AVRAIDARADQTRNAVPSCRPVLASVSDAGDLVDRSRRRIDDAKCREGSRSLRAAGAAARLDDHENPGPVGRPDRSGAALGVESPRSAAVPPARPASKTMTIRRPIQKKTAWASRPRTGHR